MVLRHMQVFTQLLDHHVTLEHSLQLLFLLVGASTHFAKAKRLVQVLFHFRLVGGTAR